MFDHGEIENKPIPMPRANRITDNEAATNAPAYGGPRNTRGMCLVPAKLSENVELMLSNCRRSRTLHPNYSHSIKCRELECFAESQFDLESADAATAHLSFRCTESARPSWFSREPKWLS